LDIVPKIGNFAKTHIIMGKNTSISLGDHYENFIQYEIATGRYKSASEVVRTALRLLEIEEKKVQELRKALEQGENSQMIDDFNTVEHLKGLHSKHL
jgi:antitoxin ParD1/3/4